jgi:hypothetical protein
MPFSKADALCAHLAGKQYGVIARAQALDAGMTARAIGLRLAAGQWEIVHPGTYVIAGSAPVWEQRAAAAYLWVGPAAALSHLTAAAVFELRSHRPLVIDVTTQRRIRTAGVRVHRCGLSTVDVMKVGCLAVTTPVRTLMDLADVLDEDRLEDCVEEALYKRLVRLPELQERINAVGARGRKGAGRFHRLLETRNPACAPTESDFESLLFRVLRKAGIPLPERQYEVWDGPDFIARLDFAYPNQRVAIFADSYKWHGRRSIWEKDIHQRNKLQALAWRIRPTTWTELKSRPEDFVADVVLLRRSAA